MVLIFLLLGDEVKTFRKIVLVASALRKNYCRSSPKTTVFRAKMRQKGDTKTALTAKPAGFF